MQFNIQTMKNEVNDYDHSFKILVFGIITVQIILAFAALYVLNIVKVYRLQEMAALEKHINSFGENVKSYLDE